MSTSFKLKLFRQDVAVGSIPVLSENSFLSPPTINKRPLADCTNEVKVQYAQRVGLPGPALVTKVACEYSQGYILMNNGVLWCFEGWYGTIGDGSYERNKLWTPVNPNGDYSYDSVHCNGLNCGVLGLVGGDIYWWGNHAYGTNSTGYSDDGSTPSEKYRNTEPELAVESQGYGFVSIFMDTSFNVAFGIDGAGKLWSWGYDVYCQIGDGQSDCEIGPYGVHSVTAVNSSGSWIEISICNYSSAYGITSDGKLWFWGCDRFGSGGQGVTGGCYWYHSPTQIGTDSDWAKVAGGDYGGVALKTDGSMWAWGYDISGQLCTGYPDGYPPSMTIPTKISDGPFVDVKVAEYCGAALGEDGYLYTWGSNDWIGVLGQGSSGGEVALTPTKITTISGITCFDTGYQRMIASDGEVVWIWGWWDCYDDEFGDYPYSPQELPYGE